ncbi:MAG: sialidase family protein, partial [Planctomycetota bacterium]
MRRAVVVLSVLVAIASLGLSSASAAEELWVIKDGVLDKDALTPESTKSTPQVFLCAGDTVDGLYVVTPTYKGVPNWSRFVTAKSAVGDCELKVVFSCSGNRPKARFPNIVIMHRGTLCFSSDGSQIYLTGRKQSLPLTDFSAPTEKNPFDGQLHSMAVTRRGDKLSCYYDDKKLNEQPIDPDANLHIWFDALFNTMKIKSIKLTAAKLSDNLETAFKSAAPIEEIFVGPNKPSREHGKAYSYRIPALAVSTKGTILAFAEARRITGADVGDIDAVVKRSEDSGKTWGPEIVIMDAKGLSVNNPSPVVDPKTGRIWVMMGRFGAGGALTVTHFVSYSDDDGKTWSEPRDIGLRAKGPAGTDPTLPGPGGGIVLERGKHAGRFVVPINYSAVGTCAPGVAYSDDQGKTWKVAGLCRAGVLMVEARGVELCDGSLLFNARTGKSRKRGMTILAEGGSKDTTKMWYADDLPDPNCQGAVVRHSWPKDGKPGIILYSGPGLPTGRVQGTLFASYDDGKTWPWKKQYYQGGSGYSDACVLPDGRVAVLFEKDGKSKLGFTIVPAPP